LLFGMQGCALRIKVVRNLTNLLYTVDFGDTYSAYLAIHKHFTGATLPNTALKAAFTMLDTMAVYRKSRLMESRSDSESALSLNLLVVEDKLNNIRLGNL
jgi:hypothetical protein